MLELPRNEQYIEFSNIWWYLIKNIVPRMNSKKPYDGLIGCRDQNSRLSNIVARTNSLLDIEVFIKQLLI